MESGRGGGGRTPRGKKGRGSSRGGRGQDSPSARSPASATSGVASSPVHQSPSISSPTTPILATPPSRDEEPKVAKQSTPSSSTPTAKTVAPPVVSPVVSTPTSTAASPVASTPTTLSSPLTAAAAVTDSSTTPLPQKTSKPMETPSTVVEVSKDKDDVDKKAAHSPVQVEEVASKVEEKQTPISPPVPILTKPTVVVTKKEDLELPEPPTPPPHDNPDKGKVSTEAKVEEALKSKTQQPRTTGKTWVVSPPKDSEQTSDAPLSVDIDPACITSGASSSASASQRQQRHSRSGSVSPAGYAYALHGPVGKPGYIGGVGFSDEDPGGDSAGGEGGRGIHRRESAIAAMETAVKGFTKRQWILLTLFAIIDLLAAVTISLQAPFYPQEAEKKGANATEYGFVFASFEFIVFLTSPIYGKYMNKLGPKTVFSVCTLITSISVICFGLLDRIDDHTWFITLCFVCRIFEALGCAGFFTATFVIIACEFPETVATTFASLETFFGLGLIVGPTVGGALFGVGGFPLPFFVVGGCILVTGLLSGLVMPKIDKATDEDGVEEKGYGVWTILKIPSVALVALSIASTSMSLGFVSATLEPHIRRFGLTPLQTGLVFVVNGGMYALTAPLWGYICDYIKRPVYVTILGNLFIFISFLIIGPVDFMPFDTILWVTIIGLLIQGLGFGCCLVSGFIVGLKDSMKHGLPDNMATYGVASGLWTSMLSLGAFVGPSLGGVLYDTVGFRQGSWLILVTSFVVGVTILLHTCATSSSKSDSETEPLLRPISPLLGGNKDLEKATGELPSTSYGSTSGGDGGV